MISRLIGFIESLIYRLCLFSNLTCTSTSALRPPRLTQHKSCTEENAILQVMTLTAYGVKNVFGCIGGYKGVADIC